MAQLSPDLHSNGVQSILYHFPDFNITGVSGVGDGAGCIAWLGSFRDCVEGTELVLG